MPTGKHSKGKGLTPEQKQSLASIAEQLIGAMDRIDDAAKQALEGRRGFNASMAVGSATNPMAHRAGQQEVRSVDAISSGQTADLRHLRDEPFIARVVAEDEAGERATYYFARSMPLSRLLPLDGDLASYRGPVLATLRIPAGTWRKSGGASASTGYLVHAPSRGCVCRVSLESGRGSLAA
jgi:hypothetical protein